MLNKICLIILIGLMPSTAFAQTQLMPFQPGATISISVSNSASSAVAMPIGSVPSWQIIVQNTGSALAFCNFGGSAVTASTSSFPVPAGVIESLTMDQDHKFISCITSASTTTVYITGGIGS